MSPIPNLVFHISDQKVPPHVVQNIQKHLPNFDYKCFNENEMYNFLMNLNYEEYKCIKYKWNIASKEVKNKLFQFMYLYKHGGLYLELNILLKEGFSKFFLDNLEKKMIIVKSNFFSEYTHIFPGFIATTPNNPMFLKMFDEIYYKIESIEILSKLLLSCVFQQDLSTSLLLEQDNIISNPDTEFSFNTIFFQKEELFSHYYTSDFPPNLDNEISDSI